VLNASGGTPDAHEEVLGSPITIAEYALNCAVVIASHVDGAATVTVTPDGTAAASALDDPPFTLVDKISTDCDTARAGAGRATATTAEPATAVIATGTRICDIASSGANPAATARRTADRTLLKARRTVTAAETPRLPSWSLIAEPLGSIGVPFPGGLRKELRRHSHTGSANNAKNLIRRQHQRVHT
jgi:hypothetical protein